MVSGVSVQVSAIWPSLTTGGLLLASGHWFLALCLWVGQQQACDESFDPELTTEGLSRIEASSQ